MDSGKLDNIFTSIWIMQFEPTNLFKIEKEIADEILFFVGQGKKEWLKRLTYPEKCLYETFIFPDVLLATYSTGP